MYSALSVSELFTVSVFSNGYVTHSKKLVIMCPHLLLLHTADNITNIMLLALAREIHGSVREPAVGLLSVPSTSWNFVGLQTTAYLKTLEFIPGCIPVLQYHTFLLDNSKLKRISICTSLRVFFNKLLWHIFALPVPQSQKDNLSFHPRRTVSHTE